VFIDLKSSTFSGLGWRTFVGFYSAYVVFHRHVEDAFNEVNSWLVLEHSSCICCGIAIFLAGVLALVYYHIYDDIETASRCLSRLSKHCSCYSIITILVSSRLCFFSINARNELLYISFLLMNTLTLPYILEQLHPRTTTREV
jgi:hypothetical protein